MTLLHDSESADADLHRWRGRLKELGVQELPFCTTSAVAIVSDTDHTTQSKYEAYTDQLVRQKGLDFGDSVWLQSRKDGRRVSGLGFYQSDLRTRGEANPDDPSFLYLLREHHRGNIDHWHAFLPKGPRLLPLSGPQSVDEQIVTFQVSPVNPENREFSTRKFPLSAFVLIAQDKGKPVWPPRITVTVKPGRVMAEFVSRADLAQAYFSSPQAMVYAVSETPLERTPPPLDSAKTLVLSPSEVLPSLCGMVAVNYLGHTILEQLRELDRLGFSTNACTTHAMWHFCTEQVAQIMTAASEALLKHMPEFHNTVAGRVTLFGLPFSTLADDAYSVARVQPDMVDDLGVLFYRLARAERTERGWLRHHDVDGQLDTMSLVRLQQESESRTSIYVVRTVKPSLPHLIGEDGIDRGVPTRGDFADRLCALLPKLDAGEGFFFPIHTHLGTVRPDPSVLPRPYLDEAVLNELTRRVCEGRVWFTRLSVMCAYAAMLQSIPDAIDRTKPNVVKVDPELLPPWMRRPRALYGLTVEVDDPATASVVVGDSAVTELVRYPAHDERRARVAAAVCGIVRPLFRWLDPTKRYPREVHKPQTLYRDAQWSWHTEASGSHGRLTVRSNDVARPASMQFTPRVKSLPGAQVVSFSVRRSDSDVSFGILVETQSGHRFGFGQQCALDFADNLTATYQVEHCLPSADVTTWTRVVVPLFNLQWGEGREDSVCSPSDVLNRLTLLARGPSGSSVDFADVYLGRPKPTCANSEIDGQLLGGRSGTNQTQTVTLDAFSQSRERCVGETDAEGFFAFPNTPPGAYAVSVGRWRPRRVYVELVTHSMDVCLP